MFVPAQAPPEDLPDGVAGTAARAGRVCSVASPRRGAGDDGPARAACPSADSIVTNAEGNFS